MRTRSQGLLRALGVLRLAPDSQAAEHGRGEANEPPGHLSLSARAGQRAVDGGGATRCMSWLHRARIT